MMTPSTKRATPEIEQALQILRLRADQMRDARRTNRKQDKVLQSHLNRLAYYLREFGGE